MKFFDRLRRRLQYLGETKEDAVLLVMSERQGAWTSSDLSAATGFGPGTMLRVLARLEVEGRVRVTEYPHWRLTPAGIDRVNLLRLAAQRPEASFGGRRWE